MLRHGFRALGLTMGLALALRADRYVLGAVAGAATVGIYSVAATLSEGPRVVPAALGQLVNREVALGGGLSRVARARRTALLAAALIGLVVAVGGWFLIVPVFGEAFADARPLLLVLLVAEVAFAPFAVASRALLGGGWMTTAGLLGAAGSVVALILFALAIPSGARTVRRSPASSRTPDCRWPRGGCCAAGSAATWHPVHARRSHLRFGSDGPRNALSVIPGHELLSAAIRDPVPPFCRPSDQAYSA